MAERSQDEEQKFNRQIAAGFAVLVVILASVVFYAAFMFPEHYLPEYYGATPTGTYSKSSYPNGQKVTIVSITRSDVEWDHVKVQLSDGTNLAHWETATTDLDGGHAITHNYTTDALGTTGIDVCCVVTDISGNGFVSGYDYFTVFTYQGSTGLASGTSYTAVLIYTPTGERIGTGVTWTAS